MGDSPDDDSVVGLVRIHQGDRHSVAYIDRPASGPIAVVLIQDSVAPGEVWPLLRRYLPDDGFGIGEGEDGAMPRVPTAILEYRDQQFVVQSASVRYQFDLPDIADAPDEEELAPAPAPARLDEAAYAACVEEEEGVPASAVARAACSICQEPLTGTAAVARVRRCGHAYHAACLRRWLCEQCVAPRCPNCNVDVRATGTADARGAPGGDDG